MPEHDLEKLLGGFAADTLTAEEQQQLYRAALTEQQLFNALADEQALKELLVDPAVRRRLLQALQATQAERTGGSGSWFDWFRRPSGLAWAGGLAGGVLAVVLGTSLYQESLRQETQATAQEETPSPAPSLPVSAPTQPVTSPTNKPPAPSEPLSPSSLPALRETLTGKTSPQAPPTNATGDERRTRHSQRDTPAPPMEAETVQNKTGSSTDMSRKLADETSKSASQSITSAPPPGSTSLQTQFEVNSTTASQERTALSARSLFYGTGPQDQKKSTAQDTRRREKAMSESGQPPARSEITTQSLAMAKRTSALQPVGIRYSLAVREQSEQAHDSAMDRTAPLALTIESNQDGILQLWKQVGLAQPQLLFPISEAEQLRSKLAAHTPVIISIPSMPDRLTIRFSRADRIPSATFDSILLDDLTRGQLRESVMTDDTSDFPPPIHYIVNQDSSLSEIVARIPLPQP
jgi:hypothetical protein